MRRTPLAALILTLGVIGGCDRCSGAHPEAHVMPRGEAGVPDADLLTTVHWSNAPIDWSRPLPVTPPGGEAQAGYVGSDACKDCHRDLFTTYARHSMARTGMRPLAGLDQKWLAKIFDGAEPVQHERSRFWYRPYRQGRRYFVEEYMLDGAGARVQSRVEPLEYAYSAGSYGVAFYFKEGERYYQMPLDFYPQVNRWGIDPGASEGNPRFSKSLESFCVSCHADYPRRRAGTDDVFYDVDAGVGCERCHGPGARHVQTLSAADIVNPAHLSSVRQLDVCTQCHESNDASLRADRDQFSYRPGEPLAAYRVNYVGQPPDPGRFILLAHPERMVESACWKGSAGKMVCTSCHDPHKSSFDEPASWWDARCNDCHASKPCTETPAARAAGGGHCVPCHMRRGSPPALAQVTITDHWIQRRPAAAGATSAEPQRVVPWPELVGDPEPARGDDLTALQAVALDRAGKHADAERMAATVAGEALHLPSFYEWLAGWYHQHGRPADAAGAFATILRAAPDSPPALLGYARTMLDRGDAVAVGEATRALDRMLAVDADNPNALETKAMVLFRQDQIEGARPLFVRAAAIAPWTASSHVALAVLARRDGRDADAVAELEAARAIEPGDAWILDRLGAAYRARGDAAHASEIDRARAYFGGRAAITNAVRWLPEKWR